MNQREHAIALYKRAASDAADVGGDMPHQLARHLCQTDLFYLLVQVLGRRDVNNDWLFARCREVQASPNGHLDLWAREHFKSTIITYGKTIQDILNDPELTVGIFSYVRSIAKAFLRWIKNDFESNDRLRELFPEILWANPQREAPKWSEDDGIIVKRKSNRKESTIEAWGLVDSQPTSKHFSLMVYDDVVDAGAVSTPEMIEKVTRAWETSRNLTAEGGATRYIGTRWHHADTYKEILRRGAAIERRHPATHDGTATGRPVLLSPERLATKRSEGIYTFGAQMLLDPTADHLHGFKDGWLRYHENSDGTGMNKYLLVDPANSKKRNSDYTAIGVIGLGSDNNYYVLDMVRDRLSLRERADAVFSLHRLWKPSGVGYERYGMMADVEYIKERQAQENYRFEITEVGGTLSKQDRIERLLPVCENHRFYLPAICEKVDFEGKRINLVQSFLDDEYRSFPVSAHDDMLDMMSRIFDIETVWPKSVVAAGDRYARSERPRRHRSAWAA
jgi:predicted phage terminase large subunit-like protein